MRAFSARSFWLPVLLTTLVAAFFGAVLARRGRDVQELRERKNRLQRRLAELETENAELRAQRDALLSSPEAIERVAREEYGFAAPGETVASVDVADAAPAQSGLRTERGLLGVSWSDLPLVLTLSVFAITACIFAALNLIFRTSGEEAA